MNPTGPRYEPVVDPQGRDQTHYHQHQSQQTHSSTARSQQSQGGTGQGPIRITGQQGQTQAQYRRDLRQCKNLAKRQMGTAESGVAGALGGGAAGAALGGALGAALPGVKAGEAAAAGAASGGILGGAGGALAGNQKAKRIIADCMQERGYNVIAK